MVRVLVLLRPMRRCHRSAHTLARKSVVAEDAVQFINASPSPYHAVDRCREWLHTEGFEQLQEGDDWKGKLKAGGKYFLTRNQSTICAFAVGESFKPGNGFNIVGAHTDSCCLKVKPVSKVEKEGFLQVGVQTYGGGLWHTWFDRDLAIAGRVIVRAPGGQFEHRLVFLNRPVCRIPSLAIHLDRSVSEKFVFSTESHLLPVLASVAKGVLDHGASGPADANANSNSQSHAGNHHAVLVRAIATELKCAVTDIADFELCLVDHQPAAIGGLQNEFLFSARLDNLLSCWVALQSFLKALPTLERESRVRVIAFFDHEECGSASAHGAASDAIPSLLERIDDAFSSAAAPYSVNLHAVSLRNSFLISADMAHGVHPNYAQHHEGNHKPRMHGGMVLKVNANQRYATTTATSLLIEELARERRIPLQSFVVKNDSPCGSTIGPIVASRVGLRTVDMGLPMLSMHSIREMSSASDVDHGLNLLENFFNRFTELDKRMHID